MHQLIQRPGVILLFKKKVIRTPGMDILKVLLRQNAPHLTMSPCGSGLVLPMMKELKHPIGSPPISGSQVGSCGLKKVYTFWCSLIAKNALDTCLYFFRKCFLNEIISLILMENVCFSCF
jgi:hypothetical protein